MTNSLAKRAAIYIGILAFALVLLLFLGAGQASAEDVSGDITVDTTWASGSIINVTGDVNVTEGVSLTVEENVTVVFQGYYALNVYGNLVITGTEVNWTTFTYNSSATSRWVGMVFYEGAGGSIQYLLVDNADYPVTFDNTTDGPSMSNVIVSGGVTAISYEFYGDVRQDISLAISGLEIQDFNQAFYVINSNGSLDISLDGVIVNDTTSIGFFAAHAWGDDGRIDMTITGCEFTNSSMSGMEVAGDILGDVSITDTWFSHVGPLMFPVVSMPPMPRPVMEMYGGLSGTSFTLDGVTVDNASMGFLYSVSSGDVILTVVDCSFTDVGNYAIQVEGETVSSIQITNSEFVRVWGNVVLSMAEAGDTVIALDGVVMEDVFGGIQASVEFGNIELTVMASSLSGYFTLIDLTVNSNTLDTGFVTIDVSASSFSEAEMAFNVWCVELNPLMMVDTEFVNITGFGMYFDVRENDVSLSYDNVTMINVGMGVWLYANDGSLELEFTGVHFNTVNVGAMVEVSALTEAELSTINVTVLDSVFEGGLFGIWAVSVNGGTVLIDNSQFLGQSEVGFTYDSLYGQVDMDVVDSVFDGSSSEEAGTVYVVEQIESEYILYGQPEVDDEADWDSWSYGSSWTVFLPFEFEYNGYGYDHVYFGSDGYLNFDGGAVSIRPVGNTDLYYDNYHFMGYKIAEDNSSVLFNWYAMNGNSWYGESNAFQVILYATGEIQFNFAAMDGWGGSNAWGLLNDEWPNIDYNMYRVFGWTAWEADFTSYMFTPSSISPGMGVRVLSQIGDLDLVMNNNSVSNYYRGGVFASVNSGDVVLTATENYFGYSHATEWYMGPAGVVAISTMDGTMNATVADNTFERLWSVAVILWAVSFDGGEFSFDVTGNEFNKVVYGVYTSVLVFGDLPEDVTESALNVMANFQDNIMNDAYGLGNSVMLFNGDAVDWTVSVEQNFIGNVMDQENFEGEYPFNDYDEGDYIPAMIEAILYVDDGQDNAESILTVEQVVTVTGNELEQAVGTDSGILVENDIEKFSGTIEASFTATVTDNTVEYWGYLDDWYYYEYDQYVYYGEAIEVDSYNYLDLGLITTDASIIVEMNQVFGMVPEGADAFWVGGIDVSRNIYSSGVMSVDADATAYISVVENLVEGMYDAVDVYVDNDVENTVGTWMILVTVHVDDNQLLNVTEAIDVTMYDDVDFFENYWPYYDQVALADHTFNYTVTVDNNVIGATGYGDEQGIIYVDVSYNSQVDPSTLFTEAMVRVNGAISISGNQVTQTDASMSMIELYHEYDCDKTGVMDVAVDIAIDNNVLDNVLSSIYVMVEPAWFGIYVEEELDLDGNWDIPTDEPTVMTDVSWSITGNQMTGQFYNGILLDLDTEVESPDCYLVQNYAADISGNTLDYAFDGGLGVAMEHDNEGYGYTEINLDVNIENNVVVMFGEYDLGPRSSNGLFVGPEGEDRELNDLIGETFVVNVLIAGNTISGADTGIVVGERNSGGTAEEEGVYVNEVNVLVENNYINNSEYGIVVNYASAIISNNVLEDCGTGIGLDYASGEVVGNTITCGIGVYINYPMEVLVQGNTITHESHGVYVWYYYNESTSVQVLDNVIKCVDLKDSSYGVGMYYSMNLLISGNTITSCYGVYAYDNEDNMTISENQVSGCCFAVYLYYNEDITIEGNLITASRHGLYVEYNDDVLIGNNTITNNLKYGAYVIDNDDVVLWNNEISGNGDHLCQDGGDFVGGLRIASNDEVWWYVDAEAIVAQNIIEFHCEKWIEVLPGGSLIIQDVAEFSIHGDTDIIVDEGGLLYVSNANILKEGNYVNTIEVYGELWMNMCMLDAITLNLHPSSDAEIRASTITRYDYTAIHVNGCSPVIADNLIFSAYGKYGVFVEGEGAAPSIVSNIIALNDHGIFVHGMDMGGIYDNLIVLNTMSGILAEGATGSIHDNILLANKVEILLRNSDVSVEDNEIGYTNLFQVLANYAPLLGHFVSVGDDSTEATTAEDPVATLESVLGVSSLDMYEILTWIKAHNGIWAEDSVVETSGNVYGLMNYALYAVRSEVHFADDVRTITLNVPHADDGEMYNYSLSMHMLNGLYAAHSKVWVEGSTIEVLDDALVFESSEAWIEGATLMAGDFDYFVFGDSEVYNTATNYSKAKVMDSHSLNEGTWLTLTAMDKGEAAANVSVVIKNAKGEIVYNGTTDAEGKVRILLTQYSYTSEGKDDGFNPYTITADFESGEESMELVLDQSYQDATIEGEEESDMGAILAVVGVLVIILLIVAAVVVMRRRK